jgi:hypothetical protein
MNVFTPGEETNMKLYITFPEQGTRAAGGATATEDELKITSADIFIFDAGTKVLENHISLAANEVGTSNDPVNIRATVGQKLVAVGINLPSTFPNISSAGQLSQTWRAELKTLVSDNGIVMFSKELEKPTLVAKGAEKYNESNTISVKVQRTVAKIAVQDGGFKRDLSDGTLSDPSFTIRNSNELLFPVQVIKDDKVIDPNWKATDYNPSDFKNFTKYIAINGKTSSDKLAWNTFYTPENTSEKAIEKMSTYASIRVKFTPSNILDGSGKPKGQPWDGPSFWTVTKDGIVYYFDSILNATTYAVAIGGTPSTEYKDGYCYYNAFINLQGGGNVERNAFYNARITLVVPPGSPTPDIQHPDDQVKEPTDIKVSIEIEDWTYREEDYPLN